MRIGHSLYNARCAICALLGFFATATSAQTGALAGHIIDAESGEEVGWVMVAIEGMESARMADADGYFIFGNLPVGRYVLNTLRIGYHDARFVAELVAGDTTHIDLKIGHEELLGEETKITAQHLHPTSPLNEPEVVFSGSKLRQNLGRTIAETISYEPGIAQRSMGPAPSRPVLRGLSGDRLLVLEDGERTGDLSATSSDHAVAIEPMTTQRIEIVRGPETMLYGPNALGGVVNVQRGYVPSERPQQFGGSFSWQGESVNRGFSAGIELVQALGPLSLRGDGSWRSAGDVSTPLGALKNTNIETGNASLGLSTIRDGGYAGAAVGAYHSKYGIPPDPNGGHPNGVQINLERQHLELRGQWRDGPTWMHYLDMHHAFSRYHHGEFEDGGALGMEFGVLTHNGGAQAHLRLPGAWQRGVLGVWYEYRNYAAAGLNFTPDSEAYAGAAFAYGEWQRGPLQAHMALRADKRRIEPSQTRTSRTVGQIARRDFSGLSGGFSGQYHPSKRLSIGATLMRTFRAPGVEELFSEGPHLAAYAYEVGNGALDSERGLGLEFFVDYHPTGGHLHLALFRNDIDGYIFPKNTGERSLRRADLFLYQTTGLRALMHGAETSFAWHFYSRWQAAGALSYVRGALTQLNDEPIPRLPPLQGRVGLTYEHSEALQITSALRWAAAQKRIGPFEEPTDGYAVLDLSGQYHAYWHGHLHTFSLVVENLTDAIYRRHLNRVKEIFPEPARNTRLLHKVFF